MSSRVPAPMLLLAGLVACASTHVGDLGQTSDVPMNRVFPFPSDEERAQIGARVTLTKEDAPGIDSVRVAPAHDLIDRRIEEILGAVGARVRVEGDETDDAGDDFGEPVRDYGMTVRMNRYQYDATFEKPTNWFFKSEEEMAQVPGTCTHHAEVEVELDVTEGDAPDFPIRSYRLTHAGDDETETVDPTCPYGQEALDSLFARTLDEALVCVRVPLENEFTARGTVLAHRHEIAGSGELFETSLGSDHGAVEGLDIGVFRVQHSTGPAGRRLREERLIGSGVVTDRVRPDSSWIRVPESSITETILEGDVVRAVYPESTTAALNPWDDCREILEQR